MFYFTKPGFLVAAVERAVDAGATAALVIATSAAFDIIDVGSWVGIGKAAGVGAVVATLRHLSTNGPEADPTR